MRARRETHLIVQDREESLQQQQHYADREAPMQGCILQEGRGIVERKEPKAEDHVQELDNGRLDDDGHEDTVARGGSRGGGALVVSTVSHITDIAVMMSLRNIRDGLVRLKVPGLNHPKRVFLLREKSCPPAHRFMVTY